MQATEYEDTQLQENYTPILSIHLSMYKETRH